MSAKLNEEKIQNALESVKNDAGEALFKPEAISGIVIKDGNVGFAIEIAAEDGPKAKDIQKRAEDAILALDGVFSATAMLTAHRAPSSGQSHNHNHDHNHDHNQGQAQRQDGPHKPATHVIAVASGKGGVGKSTTSINLALALQAKGKRVGILDADIYGPSLPRLIGVNRKPQTSDKKLLPIEAWGLQTMSIGYLVAEDAPTIWRGPMVMSALEQMLKDVAWEGLDVLIIDMPPGTGDAQLTLSQRAQLAGAVIVSTPQDLALIDARKGLNMFLKVNVPVLGLIENMSHFICPSCGERSDIFGHGGAKKEAETLGMPFLGEVPLQMAIRATSDEGTPIVASQPESEQAQRYLAIADNLLASLEATQTSTPEIIIE